MGFLGELEQPRFQGPGRAPDLLMFPGKRRVYLPELDFELQDAEALSPQKPKSPRIFNRLRRDGADLARPTGGGAGKGAGPGALCGCTAGGFGGWGSGFIMV